MSSLVEKFHLKRSIDEDFAAASDEFLDAVDAFKGVFGSSPEGMDLFWIFVFNDLNRKWGSRWREFFDEFVFAHLMCGFGFEEIEDTHHWELFERLRDNSLSLLQRHGLAAELAAKDGFNSSLEHQQENAMGVFAATALGVLSNQE